MRSFIGKVSSSGRRARLAGLAALLSLAAVALGLASMTGAEHTQAQAPETATLRIQKVNIGGTASEVFTGTYSGPVSGTFSVSQSQPFSLVVPLGTYTISEDVPIGSTYVGGFTFTVFEPTRCTGNQLFGAPAYAQPGAVSVTLSSQDPFPPTVCLLNQRAALTVKKVNLGGNASELFTGTYSGPVSGTFTVSESQPFSLAVPLGTYTVTEDTPAGSPYVGGFTFTVFESTRCTSNQLTGAPAYAEPGAVSVTLLSQEPFPPSVCLLNQRAALRINKVNLGGSSAEVFTGTYSGPVSGTFEVSQSLPFSVAVPLGTYTVTEDAKPGSAYVGGLTFSPFQLERCTSNQLTGAPAFAQAGPVSINFSSRNIFPSSVCLVNEPVSEVQIVKHDEVDAAHGGNTGQWTFSLDGGAEGFAVVGVPRADGTTQTVSHKFGTNPASGTVIELAGNPTACFDQIVKSYETHVGSPGSPGVSAPFSSTPGTAAEVHFYNVDCGKVLGAGTLDVVKFNDLDGDKTQDPGETELAWEVTVSCPGEPDRVATTPAHFIGLPNNTNCTVTETPASGHRVIGWRSSDVGTATGEVTSDGTGVTTFVHVDDGDILSVTFYNQPRVNVRVHKRELLLTGVANGQGWAITVTGCGVNQTLATGADGTATFSDLPPCTFTVSEKIDSKPGFGAVAPNSVQVVAMLAGETVGVSFTNANLAGICSTCNNPSVIATPTATPTPTPTAPLPTATQTPPTASTTTPPSTQAPSSATPTRTPTISVGTQAPGLTDEQRTATAVAGARTASAQQSTPIVPRTGERAMDGPGGTLNLALLAAGLVVLGGGLGLVAIRGSRR